MESIESVRLWHAAARPDPAAEDFSVQLGCHLEEVAEMLRALKFDSEAFPSRRASASKLQNMVDAVAHDLKQGAVTASVKNRVEVLDSLCDQIVTAVGVGYCAGMNVAGGLEEVNRSNWSKFVNGVPMKNEYGKIVKGDGYKAPDLKDFV